MKTISFSILCFCLVFLVNAQRIKIEFGLQNEADYAKNEPIFQVNDSIFILAPEKKLIFNKSNEPRFFINFGYNVFEKDKWYFSLNVNANTRYVKTDLGEIENINNNQILVNRGLIPNQNTAILLFGDFGLNIRKISFELGLGSGIHFRDISSNIDNRETYELLYQAVQRIHKSITLNYQFQASFSFTPNFSFFGRFQESIGTISKPVNIYEEEVDFPLKWRSFGFGLSYHFDLPGKWSKKS